MLPFTKRPGRDDSDEVFTKDDLETTSAKSVRRPMPSVSDEELTQLMPSKMLGNAVPVVAAPIPAAGRPPASVPAPRSSNRPPPSVPPPSRSARDLSFLTDDDDEGNTMVRSNGPRVVKRTNAKMGMATQMPTTVSPSAVIKSALDTAHGGKRNDLLPGLPADLIDDVVRAHSGPQAGALPVHGGMMPGVQPVQALQPFEPIPAPPRSVPAPPPSYPQNFGPAPYGPGASQSVSVPGVAMNGPGSMPGSMPAHFMVPHAPYSDARTDPPATSVTARTKVAGRPAMSWAVALLAFGLFVGVGAVALMAGREGIVETTASFVDPSRAGAKQAAAQPPPAAQPATDENKVAVPGVAVPAAAPTTPPATTAAPAAPPVAANPAPAAPAAAATNDMKAEKKTEEAKAEKKSTPAPRWTPPPRAAAPAPKPVEKDEVASSAPAEKKPAKATAKPATASKGGSDVDEETKKALEALQKSQLESSF